MTLLSICWCEGRYVNVPVDLVLAGLTFPCNQPKCYDLAVLNGWTGPPPRRQLSPDKMASFYRDRASTT